MSYPDLGLLYLSVLTALQFGRWLVGAAYRCMNAPD
jgi:hypothetical protein